MTKPHVKPLWHYHLVRLLRSASIWIAIIIAGLAATQGLVTQHTPELMKALAGPEMSEILASTMPEPSWQESYAGWMKNLAQIISLVVITINALSSSKLTRNGDIPFILTKNTRRSHYLITSTVTTWSFITILGFLGATLAWLGTIAFFPKAPYAPVVLATLIWVLQMVFIHSLQLLTATIKPGAGLPLAAGFALYLLANLASIAERIAAYSPLGLSTLSNPIATQNPNPEWAWPVATSLVVIAVLTALSVRRFNHAELS